MDVSRQVPYKNYKFRVRWDGKVVAGVSNVSALRRTNELVEHRDGGDLSMTHKSPGQTTYEAITLQRGQFRPRDTNSYGIPVNSQFHTG